MSKTTETASAARDFTMARLAACRGALALAVDGVDAMLALFLVPSDDAKGKDRAELLEAVDDHIGEAARSVQLAQGSWGDVDPREEEPDIEEDEDSDDSDSDSDDDDD